MARIDWRDVKESEGRRAQLPVLRYADADQCGSARLVSRRIFAAINRGDWLEPVKLRFVGLRGDLHLFLTGRIAARGGYRVAGYVPHGTL